ncbi:YjgR domain-containing protein [Campylobacter blaseri]|uniref:Helicase HerA central domain-containing protein n=1 Tax=Campylobacter blaseri TaxID=2042961 RepID=A0A2P8R172_9BACT|nr:DUF87 domain-containing protein [Campylobacter blaseri]PSM52247.1 hypothetical protein CQ405_04110 [Campylobacter blaseri]PSM54013.1 hypothetical protein CRN67_04110 [Campylobacter blaseri]QKF85451.1 YjgR domain-containing protein [Campylobacter blaseri]
MQTLQESLKYFFLGIKEDKEPYLYENKDLNTHATIIGMTGSGKTGLGITLLEEASIDNIPSIVIDPKGDMTNLALTFPNMQKEDFLPYMDKDEANNKGKSIEELAQDSANLWQKGISSTYQSIDRIKLLKDSVDVNIYTPKSSAGLGISLLSDFKAPMGLDSEDLNNYILAITSSILSLVGVNSENLTSPEIVLIQNIFLHNFSANKNVSITDLIHQIAKPPFDKIGVFDVETFFPSVKRMELAMKINGLLANPNFKAWCEGERLDISKMLFTKEGKARCNIFTISHLSDSERMFFVTLLLNEIIRWMRSTEGTSSLRAILYMDEIFGFFPPTSNPPSKTPMLTLLKQARAYGIGCVLSTQNPVDLDYKGLSNIGTWFIGRLQTLQDKERVIGGLSDISGSEFDKDSLMKLLSNLEKRKFLAKNIHKDGLSVIGTRFALNYLKGPLSSEQISNLMSGKKSLQTAISFSSSSNSNKPVISKDIKELYSYTSSLNLKPYLFATAKVSYDVNKAKFTKDVNLAFLLEDTFRVNWEEAKEDLVRTTQTKEEEGSKFTSLPSYIAGAKNLNEQMKDFKDYIYRNIKLELFSALDTLSKPGENKDQFLLRLHDKCNEILEEETIKFKEKFDKEKEKIQIRLDRAIKKLEKEKADVRSKGLDAIINIGSAILGAFFSSKTISKTNAGKLATSAKSAGRVLDEREDVRLAQEEVYKIKSEFEELLEIEKEKLKNLKETYNIRKLDIRTVEIQAKKSDIFNEEIALLWKS